MNRPDPLARLMTLAFHLNLATAAAMVLWTAWTGYLVATGQIRPTPDRTAPAAEAVPVHHPSPSCDCRHHRRDELQALAPTPAEAA